MVLGFNPSTTYAKDNDLKTNTKATSITNADEISTDYQVISREEFLKNYAVQHGISMIKLIKQKLKVLTWKKVLKI